MGQEEGSILSKEDNYTIVKEVSPGTWWIRRKKRGDELQLRILTFHLEEELNQYMKLLQRRQKIKNPHVLELLEYDRLVEQHMCSSSFKIKLVSEFPFKSLKDDLQERAAAYPPKFFTEDELWSVLYSCCHALYSLYLNKFPHESLTSSQVLIDSNGIIKVVDMVIVEGTKNYLAIMDENGTSKSVRYISPELMNLVDDNNFYYYDKEKSDVYILAMMILQLGTLEPVQYYHPQRKRFNFEAKTPALKEFKQRYSAKIEDVLQRMLTEDYRVRPKFEDVIDHIEQQTIQTPITLNPQKDGVEQEVLSNVRAVSRTNNPPPPTPQSGITHTQQRITFNIDQTTPPVAVIPPQQVLSRPAASSPYPVTTYTTQPIQPNSSTTDAMIPSSKQYTHQRHSSHIGSNTPPPPVSTVNTINTANQPHNSSFFNAQSVGYVPVNVAATESYYIPVPAVDVAPVTVQTEESKWKFQTALKDSINKQEPHSTPYRALLNLTNQQPPQPQTEVANPSALPQDFRVPQTQPQFSRTENFSIPPVINPNFLTQLQPHATSSSNLHSSSQPSPPTIEPSQSITSNTNTFLFNKQPRQSQNNFTNIQLKDNFRPSPISFTEKKDISSPISSQLNGVKDTASPDPVSPVPVSQGQSIRVSASSQPDPQEGDFTMEETEKGKFEGFKFGGVRQGIGRMFFAEGGWYQGEWQFDKMHGYGKLFYNDGKLAYEGHWSEDMFNGTGTVYNDTPEKTDRIDYKDLSELNDQWVSYEGDFERDRRHGRGVLRLTNGARFYGNFVNDSASGEGTYYSQNGEIVQGKWQASKLVET